MRTHNSPFLEVKNGARLARSPNVNGARAAFLSFFLFPPEKFKITFPFFISLSPFPLSSFRSKPHQFSMQKPSAAFHSNHNTQQFHRPLPITLCLHPPPTTTNHPWNDLGKLSLSHLLVVQSVSKQETNTNVHNVVPSMYAKRMIRGLRGGMLLTYSQTLNG